MTDQSSRASLTLRQRHALLAHYARMLRDLQKLRIATDNRTGALEREGFPEDWQAPFSDIGEVVTQTERDIQRQMERLAKGHFMADWIKDTRGIGLTGFALLIGVTGPLDQFATVSKVWRYLGLAVDDGHAPKKVRGEKLNWSPQGRVLCYQLAESIVKVGGPYRELYDRKKADYEANRPDWPQLRRHRAAMRYAVKALVKDLWVEWHRRSRVLEVAA